MRRLEIKLSPYYFHQKYHYKALHQFTYRPIKAVIGKLCNRKKQNLKLADLEALESLLSLSNWES
jgi:hypothetical protein